MDFRENKIEIGIAVLTAFMIAGLFRAFGGMGADSRIETKDISYEMPRAKNDLVGEFGLDGREIDRRYVNPFEKKNKAVDAAAAKKAAIDAAEKAKKVAAENAKKAAEAAAAAAKKKAETKVRVVDAKNRSLSGDGAATPENPPQPNGAEMIYRKTAGESDPQNKKDVLSPAQWRALLSAQPTRENLDKLILAVRAGEAESETFYAIIEEFLGSQNGDKQKLALYGVNQVPSARSFILVASAENLTGEVKTSADTFISGYAATSRHGALMQVLTSSDHTAALRAAAVVEQGISSSKNGLPNTTDPRQSRDQEQVSSVDVWSRFIPIFQKWATGGDASLQAQANEILAMLNASSTGTGVASL